MMTQTKHTPGRWRASSMTMSKENWSALHTGKHSINVVLRGCDVIAAIWCGDDKDGEEQANARMIAAAPDMLEALRSIANESNKKTHDWEALVENMRTTAISAIAKATGQ